MQKVIFAYTISSSLEEGEFIISLDPSVSFFLSQKNIKYHILPHYYEERKLRKSEDMYFCEQLNWFSEFDDFIKSNISLCKEYDINLATSNYLRLKYFIDTLIIDCFILNEFFTKIGIPREILYIYNSLDAPFTIFDFKKVYPRIFSFLLKLFCKKLNIIYREEDYFKKSPPSSENISYFKIKFLKSLFNFVKYKKYKRLFSKKNTLSFKEGVLFLHPGSIDIDYPLKELISGRMKIFVQEKGKIIREDVLIRKALEIFQKKSSFIEDVKKECNKCAQLLDMSCSVVSWINEKCSLDISEITLPFLRNFIRESCFNILIDAYVISNFYKKEKIKYIFSRGNTDVLSQKFLIAKMFNPDTKCIGIQHASFAFDTKVVKVFETFNYDFLLTRDSLSTQYFKEGTSVLRSKKVKIFQVPFYLRYVKNRYCKKYKKRYRNSKEIVVYVQKKFSSRVRAFNNLIYPLEWYFEFQKKLIDFFATKKSYYFIYKHAPSQKWAENSIIPYIKKRNYSNISVSYKHFLEILGVADRVIVDFPSGALFEACICGKPVLCLYKDYIRIIPQAKTIFGKSLRGFTDFEEACRIIEEFLKTPPQEYKVDIPFDEVEFMQIFRKIIYGQKESI